MFILEHFSVILINFLLHQIFSQLSFSSSPFISLHQVCGPGQVCGFARRGHRNLPGLGPAGGRQVLGRPGLCKPLPVEHSSAASRQVQDPHGHWRGRAHQQGQRQVSIGLKVEKKTNKHILVLNRSSESKWVSDHSGIGTRDREPIPWMISATSGAALPIYRTS